MVEGLFDEGYSGGWVTVTVIEPLPIDLVAVSLQHNERRCDEGAGPSVHIQSVRGTARPRRVPAALDAAKQ